MSDVTLPKPERTDADYFDVAQALAAHRQGDPVAFPPFELVHLPRHGLSFCLNMKRDPVQNALRAGDFFEAEDLAVLKNEVKSGAYIIDVGANIGNHALYFLRRMQAARVVVIEPNPLALAPLVANVLINQAEDVIDMSRLGVGLSDENRSGYGMKRHDRNLGATKMFAGQGDLELRRGDDLLSDETPDLIKIDVEGMEIDVLCGLEKTVERCRPTILVEIDDGNETLFEAWLVECRYRVVKALRHNRKNCNYIVKPRD